LDSLIFPALLILVFIGIPIGLGLLFYFIPKKLGYPRTAKYLIISYLLILFIIPILISFEDRFFSRSDAKALVEEQGLRVTDEFELLDNESTSAIGEYYHIFTLKISERDKQNAISDIRTSDNFKTGSTSADTLMYQKGANRYFGKKVTQNYETEDCYVREYFEPSGREGYAPTFRRISISKTKNELTFEDIDD
jgi:hypothetical protein